MFMFPYGGQKQAFMTLTGEQTTTPHGEVIFECGWHKQTSKQIARTGERLARTGKKPNLGVIVTETLSEKLDEDTLVVPAAMFLLG